MFNEKPNREFQPGLNTESLRRTRQDDRLKLRRADRENRLQAKRQALSNRSERTYDDPQQAAQTTQGGQGQGNPAQAQQGFKKQQMLQQLPQYVQGCYTDHPATQFECTQRIRKLLSIEQNPPIKEVIDSGVVTRLVQFLQFWNMPRLQFEAAWALTNIASGTAENTAVVIRYGAVPVFVSLLEKSQSDEVKEQAIWALGNIAGDSPECRNLVLGHGALSALLPLCHTNLVSQAQTTLLRNSTWTLSNFCRGKPCPEWKYVQLAIKALSIMLTCQDVEILQDACWAFSYLSDTDGTMGAEHELQQMLAIKNSGSLDRLISLLEHQSPQVRHPALRTIGNIVTGSDEQTQYVLNLGVLSKLQGMMTNDRPPIKREACWTISNITAGSPQQIEAVIAANLFLPLIQILKNEKYEISKEALWAISNATSGGSPPQLAFLVNQGVIPPLCSFLKNVNNKKILMVALEGIENILRAGQKTAQGNGGRNNFADYVEECGGVDYLEQLQSNQSIPDEIFEKAAGIIKTYFDGAEETDMFGTNGSNRVQGTNGADQAMQPQQAQNGAQFAFGTGNNLNQQSAQGQGSSGQNFSF